MVGSELELQHASSKHVDKEPTRSERASHNSATTQVIFARRRDRDAVSDCLVVSENCVQRNKTRDFLCPSLSKTVLLCRHAVCTSFVTRCPRDLVLSCGPGEVFPVSVGDIYRHVTRLDMLTSRRPTAGIERTLRAKRAVKRATKRKSQISQASQASTLCVGVAIVEWQTAHSSCSAVLALSKTP